MPKFLAKANYLPDGLAGLMKEGGTSRRAAMVAAIESVGGTAESLYFAFGDHDVYGIVDFPDEASAAAVSMMVNASGAVEATFTPLLTAEDMDEAIQKTPVYRPPGA